MFLSLSEGGFDCSGLLYAVLRQQGLSVKRTAAMQSADGRYQNVRYSDLLPGDGVYLASASSLEGRPAALYVGTRPTFGSGERRAEVHVLDHEANLYGATLAVDLVERIRGDEAFGSAEELATRIGEDLARVRERAAARGM